MLSLFCGFQAAHFGLMSMGFTYFPLWLDHFGYSKQIVGTIVSLETTMRMVGFALSLFLSILSLKKRMGLLSIFATFCLAGSIGFVFGERWEVISILTLSFFCGMWAITPFVEAYAMASAKVLRVDYGKLISFGSLAFLLGTFVGGALLSSIGIEYFPYLLLTFGAIQLIALIFFQYFFLLIAPERIPRKTQKRREKLQQSRDNNQEVMSSIYLTSNMMEEESLFEKLHDRRRSRSKRILSKMKRPAAKMTVSSKGKKIDSSTVTKHAHESANRLFLSDLKKSYSETYQLIAKNKHLMLLLFTAVIVFGVHGATGSYVSLLWKENGWSEQTIGLLWGLGLMGELIFFYFCKINQISPKFFPILLFTAIITSIGKFALQGYFISSLPWQLALQSLAFTAFSLLHIVLVGCFMRELPSKLFASVQAIYHFFCHGLAPTLLIGFISYIYVNTGGVLFLYIASAICFLAFPIAYLFQKRYLASL